eukprot:CAMPEP_0181291694 /NCGR_PEP_ID=MMETSP1101-20121128/2107_1 /TAXON_ID=46948 /ORGANISM="Rhodomonas abbreviata, Strain Caron Lab Isolate" /LENGTH=212 /DNA_ID=CAMNT_0023396109 /DNA_START=124 /DNA_END=762 /DNA_ORIENTATION=+
MTKGMFGATAPNIFKSLPTGNPDTEEMVREVSRARIGRVNSVPSGKSASVSAGQEERPLESFVRQGSMDAEDLRFHAIRRVVMDHSSKKKLMQLRRTRSEGGFISKAMTQAVEQLVLDEQHIVESSEQLAKIIADFSGQPDNNAALPYLSWACAQLGVESSYPEFEARSKAVNLQCHDAQAQEDEMSLEEMIEDSSPLGAARTAPPLALAAQ